MNDVQDIRVKVWDPDGLTMEFTTPWDSGMEDIAQMFRTIMFWLTWSPAQIDEVIVPIEGWPELDKICEEKEDEFGNTKE